MALDIANRGYVMETGHIALDGPTRSRNAQCKAYLGD